VCRKDTRKKAGLAGWSLQYLANQLNREVCAWTGFCYTDIRQDNKKLTKWFHGGNKVCFKPNDQRMINKFIIIWIILILAETSTAQKEEPSVRLSNEHRAVKSSAISVNVVIKLYGIKNNVLPKLLDKSTIEEHVVVDEHMFFNKYGNLVTRSDEINLVWTLVNPKLGSFTILCYNENNGNYWMLKEDVKSDSLKIYKLSIGDDLDGVNFPYKNEKELFNK